MTTMEWKKAYKTQVTDVREYIPGEDLSKVSVQPDYVPKLGDWIARDPRKPDDNWLISSEFFDTSYELDT